MRATQKFVLIFYSNVKKKINTFEKRRQKVANRKHKNYIKRHNLTKKKLKKIQQVAKKEKNFDQKKEKKKKSPKMTKSLTKMK